MIGRLRKKLHHATDQFIDKKALKRIGENDRKLISSILSKKLTYLNNRKLVSIIETCRFLEANQIEGSFIEAGCALGGSSILIAKMKSSRRPLLVYDVFEMIPPPTSEDPPEVHERYKTIIEGKSKGIKGDDYYGYVANLYEVVKDNFRDFEIDMVSENVELIKGLVQDTMHLDEPVALAHIDVDWYEPVKTCLERITPNLSMGGSIILDDYNYWGGCKIATDEFLEKNPNVFELDGSMDSVKLTRVK